MDKHYVGGKLEFRSLEESGRFTGYASVFGHLIPYYNEVVDRGAFKQTLTHNGGKVPILFNHDPDQWIGRGVAAGEDDHGLLVEGELLINDIPKAREAYALIRQGIELNRPAGISIGFEMVKRDIDEDRVTHVKEAKLWEYSITPFPANEPATVTALRHLVNRGIITPDQLALANAQGALQDEAGDFHSISAELDTILQNIRGH